MLRSFKIKEPWKEKEKKKAQETVSGWTLSGGWNCCFQRTRMRCKVQLWSCFMEVLSIALTHAHGCSPWFTVTTSKASGLAVCNVKSPAQFSSQEILLIKMGSSQLFSRVRVWVWLEGEQSQIPVLHWKVKKKQTSFDFYLTIREFYRDKINSDVTKPRSSQSAFHLQPLCCTERTCSSSLSPQCLTQTHESAVCHLSPVSTFTEMSNSSSKDCFQCNRCSYGPRQINTLQMKTDLDGNPGF